MKQLVRELLQAFEQAPTAHRLAIATPRFRVAYGKLRQLLAEGTDSDKQQRITLELAEMDVWQAARSVRAIKADLFSAKGELAVHALCDAIDAYDVLILD